jgi:4-hydroxyacetophenone monooxygenase
MYGPGTNLAHGGSLIFHSECQMSYIGGCIDELVSGGLRAIEVRQDVHDAYQDRYQKEIDSMVWSSPAIRHTWYKGPDGRIHLLSPWPLGDYWRWTKAPERDDFLLR